MNFIEIRPSDDRMISNRLMIIACFVDCMIILVFVAMLNENLVLR